jgi:hypothetical protein
VRFNANAAIRVSQLIDCDSSCPVEPRAGSEQLILPLVRGSFGRLKRGVFEWLTIVRAASSSISHRIGY